MAETPWITIVGLGEDGPDGLTPASAAALSGAEIVMGPPRHLGLLPEISAQTVHWPVPFADGIDVLRGFRGQNVVVLASGDPFWFGAGAVIARAFGKHEWTCLPAPSSFSLVANRVGWSLEQTICLGLHAGPVSRLRPVLAPGARIIATLRDGAAVSDCARYLADTGFGGSTLMVCEALGGPKERVSKVSVAEALKGGFSHPVMVALEIEGNGAVIPASSGLPDELFETDGVMTKRAVRAVTLSSLAPKPGELLWDIGGGSGSVAIEWLLAHSRCKAIAVEPRADRVGLIRANADRLGVDRLQIVQGKAPDVLVDLPEPDVVFVGGGLSVDLLETLQSRLASGTRLVANAVTLEGETLLARLHREKGGDLIRLEVAHAAPLGPRRGWKSAYPVVQWGGQL